LHSSAQIKFLHQGTHSALQKHNKKFHTKIFSRTTTHIRPYQELHSQNSSQQKQPIFGHINPRNQIWTSPYSAIFTTNNQNQTLSRQNNFPPSRPSTKNTSEFLPFNQHPFFTQSACWAIYIKKFLNKKISPKSQPNRPSKQFAKQFLTTRSHPFIRPSSQPTAPIPNHPKFLQNHNTHSVLSQNNPRNFNPATKEISSLLQSSWAIQPV
jgi:hypothetical protein